MEERGNDKPNTRTRKKPLTIQQVGDIHGKVPPQDIELEKVVLGAIMLEKGTLAEVADELSPDIFYQPQHVKIYEAITRLFGDAKPIDILTVTAELRKSGDLEYAGGPYYIASLTNRVGSSANIQEHVGILLQKAAGRKLIEISDVTIRDAYEDTIDIFDLIDQAENSIMQLNQRMVSGKEAEDLKTIIAQNIKHIEAAFAKDGPVGIPTGIDELDKRTGGWQDSDLIILAARPGMGKTAFVLTAARAAAEANYPVAIFNLEMRNIQLSNRMLAAETGIENRKLFRGDYDNAEELFTKLNAAADRLNKLKIFIDETAGLSVIQFRAKAKKLIAKHGVKLIIIDYLQLMRSAGKSGNREAEVSEISRILKQTAKELNVPIIALSQLSREVEKRGGDKRPQLSDLRESGAIEQDADMVCFIYRPEYYGFTHDKDGNFYPENYAEILIEKQRSGGIGYASCKYIEKLTKFANLQDDFMGPPPPPAPPVPERNNFAANTGFDEPPFHSNPPTHTPTPGDDAPF